MSTERRRDTLFALLAALGVEVTQLGHLLPLCARGLLLGFLHKSPQDALQVETGQVSEWSTSSSSSMPAHRARLFRPAYYGGTSTKTSPQLHDL